MERSSKLFPGSDSTRRRARSLLIRLASLAAPLLTAAVVDRVLPGRSVALLIAVAVAALALAAYASAASFLRAHLLLHLQTTLDSTLAMDFVRHLASKLSVLGIGWCLALGASLELGI